MPSLKEDLKLKVPTTLVIFGVTGDLSRKKLLPAIFDLYLKGLLPDRFRVVGFSRRSLSSEEFKKFVSDVLSEKKDNQAKEILKKFLEQLYYVSGSFDQLVDYTGLSEALEGYDDDWGVCSNKLLYLAVPPVMYENIFANLKKSGLARSCALVNKIRGDSEDQMTHLSGWTRVLVEKPFGRDLKTAEKLEKKLSQTFKEDQIFRIDHYLAKETIQNILSFRFANSLFEPVWNNQYISKIEIRLFETGDIAGRGAFYDSVGVLRDVGQNHLLQMLAVVAMDRPTDLSCPAIRGQRAKLLGKLKLSKRQVKKRVILGQYAGYRSEPGVEKDSQTATYFKADFTVSGSRWWGTEFVLESGKALKQNLAEIKIHFRTDNNLFSNKNLSLMPVNTVTFSIQPDEGIAIRFWAKKPGFKYELVPTDLAFKYGHSWAGEIIPDAYERLLHDALLGDQTLFATTEEVSLSWRFITTILEESDQIPLIIYEPRTLPVD